MGVADGDGQSIGGVVRLWHRGHAQHAAGHLHHLELFRLAVAHHGLLHLGGGVLRRGVALLGAGAQDHTPGLGHLDAGGDVVVEKQFLDGHGVRLDLVQKGQGVLVDLGQPQVEGGMGLCGDGAAADQLVG